MPVYEYLCRGCEGQIELLVRNPEEKLVCPECGGEELMRLLSAPAAHCSGGPAGGPPEGPGGPCGSGCGCFPGG